MTSPDDRIAGVAEQGADAQVVAMVIEELPPPQSRQYCEPPIETLGTGTLSGIMGAAIATAA